MHSIVKKQFYMIFVPFLILFLSYHAFAVTIIDGSWESLPHCSEEDKFEDAVMDITIDPGNNNILYIGTRQGIYKSLNKGQSWEKILNGFIRRVVVDPTNSDILYAGPPIYKSINRGATWTAYAQDTNLASLDIAIDNPHILFIGEF